jgi:hypothetical protein
MPLDRRAVEAALLAKGFRRVDGDHAFFIYHSLTGRKSPVRTKTSHGTGYRDIADGLVSQMAKQCRITTPEFRDLVACPLSRAEYEAKLSAQGLVEPPG